ncbi:putative transcription factor interactor and regulator CCHC(Zn) family [Medicago truncatula]|uniref:Putative transcription factor interactor and regulator CCHC(Zn) family n=1 Tax=Medicago truncatula TaxID=3880 RepID=A0A396H5H6_MEDTR|nr:putative transcription factor interactor and regulator CCHC(Zn) family [Medicago truncatula]
MADKTTVTVENPEQSKEKPTLQGAKAMETSLPDPLLLHHSDTPGISLVNQPLNGGNYGEWSRSMLLSLSAKNKLGLIDGTVKAPSADDPKLPLWKRCNDLVLTWILHSIEPDIARSVIFSDTAAAVWSDLHDRFSQGDESRIYQIRQEISECRQGSLLISDYYTKLKSLWDELGSYQEPITCSCDMLKKVAVREEKEKVMQFLMGLNESYSQVRGSILMMNPLPDTRKVHGLILQQERQMEVVIRRETPPISHAMQIARTPTPQSGTSSYRKDSRCTYCEQGGHSVDRCYYLNGFPIGHKWHGKNVKPRNKKVVTNNVEVKRESTNDSPTFTAEEYRQIMAMLHNRNGNDQPLANASGILTSYSNNIGYDAYSTLYWIVDSGATDHVSHLSPTHNKNKAPRDFVGLPNGEKAAIENIGSIQLSSDLSLDGVLHVPKFHVNLISVLKLIRSGGSSVLGL